MADEEADPSVGLCRRCRWVRIQDTQRGARFYRCALADENGAFLQYPPLPVLRCTGFDPTADQASD